MSTTVIIPGLDGLAEIEIEIDLGEVPKALKKKDTFLMKAVVDHLENVDPNTGAVSEPFSGDPKNQMKLKVDKCFLNWCCWSKDCCPK